MQDQSSAASIVDLPAHLLLPHLQDLEPQHRRALMQTSKAMFDLALATAPSVQVRIGVSVDGDGQCSSGMQGSLAAQAIQHRPFLQLCLKHDKQVPEPAAHGDQQALHQQQGPPKPSFWSRHLCGAASSQVSSSGSGTSIDDNTSSSQAASAVPSVAAVMQHAVPACMGAALSSLILQVRVAAGSNGTS